MNRRRFLAALGLGAVAAPVIAQAAPKAIATATDALTVAPPSVAPRGWVLTQPSWFTEYFVSDVTPKGFTVNFALPAPPGAVCGYVMEHANGLIHPEAGAISARVNL